jgi:hypothetical protein
MCVNFVASSSIMLLMFLGFDFYFGFRCDVESSADCSEAFARE